ncbi:hypothetical protein [Salinibacterium sp. ZJ70]|uniref:hypothetical protein n=1 Tax=Salinibacterium sp. ZJ70 TaxID=2708084 RepID=UPI0014221A37|nr:hypothetical protein [Salinibacterium sp. ZJ70]
MEHTAWIAAGLVFLVGFLVIIGAVTVIRWQIRRSQTPRLNAESLISTLGPLDPDEALIFYMSVAAHYEKNLTLEWGEVQSLVAHSRMYVRARRNAA